MLDLAYQRGSEYQNVDLNKVRLAYEKLCKRNPLLAGYNTREKMDEIIEYHIITNHNQFQVASNWKDNILMPYESVDPNAAEYEFMDLVIAHDGSKSIPMKYPALMALLFPYLFVDGVGHYSLIPQVSKPLLDQHNNIIPKNRGGNAEASKWNTLTGYLKTQLLKVDRRFARDPSFLF